MFWPIILLQIFHEKYSVPIILTINQDSNALNSFTQMYSTNFNSYLSALVPDIRQNKLPLDGVTLINININMAENGTIYEHPDSKYMP